MGSIVGIATRVARGDVAKKTDGTTGAKSDTLGLSRPAIAFILHTAGSIRFADGDGNTVNFASGELAVGVAHALEVRQVMSTGTSLANSEFSLLCTKI